MNPLHQCPACARKFNDILDFPRVRILEFERLPIPEAIDCMSGAAAEKRLSRLRAEPFDPDASSGIREEGINRTPMIARACDTVEVRGYLGRLATLQGREAARRELLPPLAAHGRFKWAYPVPDTGIYLLLSDADTSTDAARVAEVQVYCDGANMGSAGGPTLQSLGTVARLR